MKLNLGCGAQLLPGWINVDRASLPGVVVHDLDEVPWPWADASATLVQALDVFEHVGDAIAFMTECWRVLATNGHLRIRTPHWQCRDAFTDPTHRRFPTEHTFDYWIPGRTLYQHNAAYGGVAFAAIEHRLDGGQQLFLLRKLEM